MQCTALPVSGGSWYVAEATNDRNLLPPNNAHSEQKHTPLHPGPEVPTRFRCEPPTGWQWHGMHACSSPDAKCPPAPRSLSQSVLAPTTRLIPVAVSYSLRGGSLTMAQRQRVCQKRFDALTAETA